MTFERTFTLKCLSFIEQILFDDKELSKAIHHFTEDRSITDRFYLGTKITDAKNWSNQEKLYLSAATFEAILRSSLHFYAENTERALQINDANTTFLEKYIPLLTANTDEQNRLESVRKNIESIKADLQGVNPHSFFNPALATGLIVLTTAVATLVFSKNK